MCFIDRSVVGVSQEEGIVAGTARHNKGCNCKKSGCLKKYCECFQAGIFCGDNCKCIDCKNFEVCTAKPAQEAIAPLLCTQSLSALV